MKRLLCCAIALGSGAWLLASGSLDDYPLAVDPGTGEPWTGREVGIDREAVEHELIATVAGFLAGKFLQVYGRWPTSLDELLSTVDQSERAKAKEWFDERAAFAFTQKGEELEIACQKLSQPERSKIIVFLERASTVEEVQKKMKIKKGGEPDATDNPGDAQ